MRRNHIAGLLLVAGALAGVVILLLTSRKVDHASVSIGHDDLAGRAELPDGSAGPPVEEGSRRELQARILVKDSASGSPVTADVFFGSAARRHSPKIGPHSITTDANGICNMDWTPPPDADVLCAVADGYVTGSMAIDDLDSDGLSVIELTKSFTSTFTCTLANGEPATGVVITLSRTNPFPFRDSVGTPGCDPRTAVLQTVSEFDGRATVEVGTAGRYFVACRHAFLVPVADTAMEVNLTNTSVHRILFRECFAAVVESQDASNPIVASAIPARKRLLQQDRGMLRTICSIMHKEIVALHPGRVGILGLPQDGGVTAAEMKLLFASGAQMHHIEPLRAFSPTYSPTRIAPPTDNRCVDAEIQIISRSGNPVDYVPLSMNYHGVRMELASGRSFRILPGSYSFSVIQVHAPKLSEEIGEQKLYVEPQSRTRKVLKVARDYYTSHVIVEWPDNEQDLGVHIEIDEDGARTLAYNWETPYRTAVLCLSRPSRVRATTTGYSSGDWRDVTGDVTLRMTVDR